MSLSGLGWQGLNGLQLEKIGPTLLKFSSCVVGKNNQIQTMVSFPYEKKLDIFHLVFKGYFDYEQWYLRVLGYNLTSKT